MIEEYRVKYVCNNLKVITIRIYLDIIFHITREKEPKKWSNKEEVRKVKIRIKNHNEHKSYIIKA